ncbi:MAG TPA: dipeptidase [Verrucomicrobiae bacterium]|jgi:acetylornithine deacetylase/succinyl-diaminopimelate desuccinylase-like protein|nr:dipeptidase [Verrucomicrobiae bacterium]
MDSVLNYLADNNDRFLDELCRYLRFPSVSAQPAHAGDMTACAEWLVDHCRKIGLEARLAPTPGHPVVVAKTPRRGSARKPHFLVYGHYDVQPPEPFELWKTPPFEPRIEGRSLFARGSSDNKGQNFAHLKAIESYLRTGTELPCDLTFVIEGEEEVGSRNLASFLTSRREELKCAAVIISDTGMPSLNTPALTYALRGIIAFEVTLHGPSRDLHSGIYGGSVENPAMALSQMLAQLRDKNGRVAIPGFYDDVAPLSAYERKQAARFPMSDKAYLKLLGSPKLFGERGYSWVEQRSSRPTIEINGLTSGYQGAGSKTIIPARASAKLTFRLVPNQDPRKIRAAILKRLRALCPPTVRLEVVAGHGGDPYIVSPTSAMAQAALKTLRAAFGHEPIIMREGGSIPIVTQFKKILRADSLLLGLALPDDNAHSPNEKFNLDCFEKGMRMSALLWPELARA